MRSTTYDGWRSYVGSVNWVRIPSYICRALAHSPTDGETWVKVAFGVEPTEEPPCGSPVQQTPTSLTPNALTMEEPSTQLGDNGYRSPSCSGQGSSEGQPWPENIYYSMVTADLDHYGHAETEFSQWIPAPTAMAANMSSGGFAALPEGLSVQPRSLCPLGSGFVPSHFVSQPTIHTDSPGYDLMRRDDSASDSPARQLRVQAPTEQPSLRRPTPRAELPPPSTASSIIAGTVRGRFSPQEDNRLIRLVQLCEEKWAKILKEDMVLPLQVDEKSLQGRTRKQLRHRAKNLKLEFYRYAALYILRL